MAIQVNMRFVETGEVVKMWTADAKEAMRVASHEPADAEAERWVGQVSRTPKDSG